MNAPLTRPLVFHPPGDTELARRLRGAVRGEVLFDRASRGRYSTDASIYQIEPIGVLVPRTHEDVRVAVDVCRQLGVPLLRARRRQFAVRADRRRGARHRPQQVPQRRRRLRSRGDDGDGRAGHRARRAERVAASRTASGSRSTSARRRRRPSAAWPATTPAARARSPTATWCTTCVAADALLADGTEAWLGPEARMSGAPPRLQALMDGLRGDRASASATRSSARCRR